MAIAQPKMKIMNISQCEEYVKKIAIEIHIEKSFAFLNSLFQKKETRIVSPYPTLKSLKCEITKGHRCFTFQTGPLLNCRNPIQYQRDGYGLKKPFDLQYSGTIYKVKNGSGKYNIHCGKGFKTDGELYELESNEPPSHLFYRAIFPMAVCGQYPVHYIESGPFKTKTNLHFLGYVKVNLAKHKIGLYEYDFEGKAYLFVDCHTKTTKKMNLKPSLRLLRFRLD